AHRLFRHVVELVVEILAAPEGQGGGAELQERFVLLLEPRVQPRGFGLGLLDGGGGGLVGGLRRTRGQGQGDRKGAAGKDRAHGRFLGVRGNATVQARGQACPCRMSCVPAAARRECGGPPSAVAASRIFR